MRKLLLDLHLYVAFLAGVFVVVFGLTGSIMAFEPEIEHLLRRKLSYVKPRPPALSLAEIGARVAAAFPGETITGYGLSTSPGLSYQVSLRRGAERRVGYVDQYSGEVLGSLTGPDFAA